MGGATGAAAGVVAAVGFSTVEGWDVAIPWYGFVGALAAAALVGTLAGAYPALRASSVPPSEVLRSM
jgi:putative ABC transport system permease protein